MPGLNSGKSRFLVSGNTYANSSKGLIVSLRIVAADTIRFVDCVYTGLGNKVCIFFVIVFVARTGTHYCNMKRASSGG